MPRRGPRALALKEGHVPECGQAHHQARGAGPQPPARVAWQRGAEHKQYHEGERPAGRADDGNQAVVSLLRRWGWAPRPWINLPTLAHNPRLMGAGNPPTRRGLLSPL